jgi:predicted dehydrogenase
VIEGLRAGIVGTGFMGEVHARAVRAAGGRVTRALGSSEPSSASGAKRLGADTASLDVRALVTDPEVDVVHVCAPNWLHHDVASRALDAGKHVVCEKPLATTVSDASALTRRAAAAGVLAVVPFVYRFHPMVREARARVARGDLGTTLVVHGSYLQDWLSRPGDTNWRVDPALGGPSRAFADVGVHWCDLVEFVTGDRITRLAGRALVAHPERGLTEDAATVTFETERGAIGSLVVSQVSPGRKNSLRFSVDGSNGSLAFDQEAPDLLWLGYPDSSLTLSRGAGDADAETGRLNVLPPGHPQGYQDAFNGLVRDAYAAIAGERPDGLPTFADGLRAAHLTEAVLVAVAGDRWIDVDGGTR